MFEKMNGVVRKFRKVCFWFHLCHTLVLEKGVVLKKMLELYSIESDNVHMEITSSTPSDHSVNLKSKLSTILRRGSNSHIFSSI
jgi:hypothetical protein